MATVIWVNTGSGDGLVPDGTKPITWTNAGLSSKRNVHQPILHREYRRTREYSLMVLHKIHILITRVRSLEPETLR